MRPKKETKTWPVKWNFRSSPRICARNSNVSRSTWPWAMLKKKKSSRRDSAKLPLYYLLAIPPPPSDRYTYRWLAIFSHARWFARTRRVKVSLRKGRKKKDESKRPTTSWTEICAAQMGHATDPMKIASALSFVATLSRCRHRRAWLVD